VSQVALRPGGSVVVTANHQVLFRELLEGAPVPRAMDTYMQPGLASLSVFGSKKKIKMDNSTVLFKF